MKTKTKTMSVVAVIATFMIPPSSHAAEIFLTGPTEADVGGIFEVDFWIDAGAEEFIGGGVNLLYDSSRVGYSGFAFNSSLSLDPAFSLVPGDDGFGMLSLLTFGNFFGFTVPNMGPLLLGTFTFDATGVGLADFSLDPNTLAGWASVSDPFFDPNLIDIFGWSVNIVSSAVPEPPVLLLLAGGVLLMTGVRRRAVANKARRVRPPPSSSFTGGSVHD